MICLPRFQTLQALVHAIDLEAVIGGMGHTGLLTKFLPRRGSRAGGVAGPGDGRHRDDHTFPEERMPKTLPMFRPCPGFSTAAPRVTDLLDTVQEAADTRSGPDPTKEPHEHLLAHSPACCIRHRDNRPGRD